MNNWKNTCNIPTIEESIIGLKYKDIRHPNLGFTVTEKGNIQRIEKQIKIDEELKYFRKYE